MHKMGVLNEKRCKNNVFDKNCTRKNKKLHKNIQKNKNNVFVVFSSKIGSTIVHYVNSYIKIYIVVININRFNK